MSIPLGYSIKAYQALQAIEAHITALITNTPTAAEAGAAFGDWWTVTGSDLRHIHR